MASRVLLAEHTTLRVGGAADEWIVANEEDDLVDAVLGCDRDGTPVLLVGGGSNLLVSDDGFRGTVVQIATTGISVRETAEHVEVIVAAGEPWGDVVSYAVDRGWAGIESLYGIPGLAGATPVQNVGAYGQEVSSVITEIRALDRHARKIVTLDGDSCSFGYRTSRFKQEPGRWVVLEVTMRLTTGGVGTVAYPELARALGVEVGEVAPIADVREGVLALRRSKGMVLDPHDHDTWSAGSFFTNPIVEPAVADAMSPDCPRYPATTGVKLSAAWLIERSGVGRSHALTDPARAALSSKHVLALSNRGSASAADLIELARDVRARVQDTFGITLEPEPTLVGCALEA
jgi:UDP-N-acetylmuramate dehydrogenase